MNIHKNLLLTIFLPFFEPFLIFEVFFFIIDFLFFFKFLKLFGWTIDFKKRILKLRQKIKNSLTCNLTSSGLACTFELSMAHVLYGSGASFWRWFLDDFRFAHTVCRQDKNHWQDSFSKNYIFNSIDQFSSGHGWFQLFKNN